jgi:hypothetical protein
MPDRQDEERRPPGGDEPQKRRRQFEESRGMTERPMLPLDEEGTGDTSGTPKPSPEEDEEPPFEDEEEPALEEEETPPLADAEPSPDESDLDSGRDAR